MNEADLTTVSQQQSTTPIRRPRKQELKNLMKRDGIWYFHKIVKGKRLFSGRKTPFSLETADLVLAKAKRDAILKAASGDELDRVLGRTSRPLATVGEIFRAYRAAPTVRAGATTRERNIGDVTRMIRLVHGAETDVETASSTVLTKQLVKEWQTKRLVDLLERVGDDVAALQAGRRGLNSSLKHMQSLFSREARDDYGTLYLPPNIKDFAETLPVAARRQDEPEPLSDALVQHLLAAATLLQKQDPGAWAAFTLMTWGGLRNKECLHARENWLEDVPAGYRLQLRPSEDFLPKGRSRAVILPRDIGVELLAGVATGPQPAPAADGKPVARHLVPARTGAHRHEAAYRRLNLWLKLQGVGIEAGKFAYRLRKYFLKKVQEQQGLMFAQAAAGHASVNTTIDHYTGRPKMLEPIKLESK